jgi:hypothetical protein
MKTAKSHMAEPLRDEGSADEYRHEAAKSQKLRRVASKRMKW